MLFESLSQTLTYLLILTIPLLFIYLGYLLATNAFEEMGFSTTEAIIIILASLLLGSGFLDNLFSIPFSSIPLTQYNNWTISINTGGALIPTLLSIYLIVKNKISLKILLVSIVATTFTTFLVTTPDPTKGIISPFPLWLIPAIIASAASIILYRKNTKKAAPLAYISGTIGVIIGADLLHLPQLLSYQISTHQNAIIGGASVFDMIFITGMIAVILDGALITNKRQKNKT